ncbi:MAG: ATP-binding protein [Acidimicrobiia bacterium]
MTADDPGPSEAHRRPGWLAEWRDIGGLGRVAVLGLVVAVGLTIVMGFSIIAAARGHLVEARSHLVEVTVDDLPPLDGDDVAGSAEFAEFASSVQRQLLGGETQRVKVWLADGTILYSDDSTLIGRSFPLTEPARAAFEGETTSHISDLEDPAHAGDREAGQLLETYVPRSAEVGPVVSVVEVEQRLDSLIEVMDEIRLNVWLSIGIGVGVLGVFLATLLAGVARQSNRRRAQAERLLSRVFRAQEDERRQIAGVLHDDVGQSLYRLLYGIEGSAAKLPADHPVRGELERMREIVGDIDVALRAELAHLHRGLVEDAGLEASLRDLAAMTVAESGLAVHVAAGPIGDPSEDGAAALFRAAQEAVVNARKHADATELTIEVTADDGGTTVVVEDDGRGIDEEPKLGLTTTGDRLERVGGRLEVRRRPAGGTRLAAWVPDRERS